MTLLDAITLIAVIVLADQVFKVWKDLTYIVDDSDGVCSSEDE